MEVLAMLKRHIVRLTDEQRRRFEALALDVDVSTGACVHRLHCEKRLGVMDTEANS
jgi:hypothetical protein